MIKKHLYDKSEWIDGVWKDEPDYVLWIHGPTAYPCVIKRNFLGVFCCFVGIDPDHPLYMMPTTAEQFKYIEIHNGVTFCDWLDAETKQFAPSIRRWWVGFDLMGEMDFCPWFDAKSTTKKRVKTPKDAPVYRDIEFARNETELLAQQLGNFDVRLVLFEDDDNGKS